MVNKIGIGVFAYNRPSHLKRVLFSLNYLKIRDFTLFIDGPKNSIDKVNNKTINFIAKEMNKSGSRIIIKNHSLNSGLKKSIVTGCDYLSKKYDSFIVIEDDCVIYENFFRFMKNNLKKNIFLKNKLGAICGFQFNEIESKYNHLSSLKVSHFIPWGWGTMSNVWLNFRNTDEKKLFSPKYLNKYSKNQDIWSKSFIDFNYTNNLNFLSPTINLVKNIGFDGTGINSHPSIEFNTKEKKPKKLNINNINEIKKIDNQHSSLLNKKVELFY